MSRVASLREAEAARRRGGSMAVFCLYVRAPTQRIGAHRAHHIPSAWQIFNKQGVCLYYREWNRPVAASDVKQDQKLMFGFLFSLKQLVAKMSPKKCAPRASCACAVLPCASVNVTACAGAVASTLAAQTPSSSTTTSLPLACASF